MPPRQVCGSRRRAKNSPPVTGERKLRRAGLLRFDGTEPAGGRPMACARGRYVIGGWWKPGGRFGTRSRDGGRLVCVMACLYPARAWEASYHDTDGLTVLRRWNNTLAAVNDVTNHNRASEEFAALAIAMALASATIPITIFVETRRSVPHEVGVAALIAVVALTACLVPQRSGAVRWAAQMLGTVALLLAAYGLLHEVGSALGVAALGALAWVIASRTHRAAHLPVDGPDTGSLAIVWYIVGLAIMLLAIAASRYTYWTWSTRTQTYRCGLAVLCLTISYHAASPALELPLALGIYLISGIGWIAYTRRKSLRRDWLRRGGRSNVRVWRCAGRIEQSLCSPLIYSFS